VKAMNTEGEGLIYLRQNFPRISKAKRKESTFIGPKAEQLFQDLDFRNQLNSTDRRAWEASENIWSNFLGNKKSENYVAIVKELLCSCCALRCNMLKLHTHFLLSHLDFIPQEMWELSLTCTVKGSIRIYPE
jgi:hypothetical protein